jgi:hypothetical protein
MGGSVLPPPRSGDPAACTCSRMRPLRRQQRSRRHPPLGPPTIWRPKRSRSMATPLSGRWRSEWIRLRAAAGRQCWVCAPAASSGPVRNTASCGRSTMSFPTSARLSTGCTDALLCSEAERGAILQALEVCGWRISGHHGAADMLGLKPTTLHAKMEKLRIRRPGAGEEGDLVSLAGWREGRTRCPSGMKRRWRAKLVRARSPADAALPLHRPLRLRIRSGGHPAHLATQCRQLGVQPAGECAL